ncbi:MAG: DUF2232 domain-containing protein [Tissierellia bacterium]|nr:DUF2232 domain-containing protein [Tissierellia bacterium]
MIKNLTKETIINLLSSTALGGFLMYLAASLGEFTTAFLAFPFLVIFLSEGWKLSLLSVILSLVIGSFFLDLASLVYLGTLALSLTFFAGTFLKKQKSLRMTILYSSFIKLALLIAFLLAGYYVTKVNPIELLRDSMYASIDELSRTVSQNLDVSAQEIEKLFQTARNTVDYGIEILPAILFMMSYLFVAVNILLGLKIAQKSGQDLGYHKKLNEYNPRDELKLASAIVAVVSMMVYILDLEYSSLIFSNLIAIISFFYFLDGVFLSDYIYFKSGRSFMRVFMPILIIFVFRSLLIYVIIGLFDIVFNIRERVMTSARK